MYNFARWLALIIPATLLGGALISEYGFGLYPCEMCIWQRWPHAVAIALALIALVLGDRPQARVLVGFAALAIAVSGVIGGFHAGVEYGWWPGVTSCSVSAGGSGAELLDAIMNTPITRCDEVQWSLFGISLAGYNFLLSLGGALLIMLLMLAGKKEMRLGR